MFAKLEGWVVALLGIFFVILALVFGFVVLDTERGEGHFGRVGAAALSAAEVPFTIRDLLDEDALMKANNAGRFSDQPAGWSFPGNAKLDGYVLLSRYDGDRGQHVVELVSLADGAVRHEWRPDIGALLRDARRDSKVVNLSNWEPRYFRMIHPYLTRSGELLIKNHGSFLYLLDSCGKKIWSEEKRMGHHSTESDGEGGFWVPSYFEPPQTEGVPAKFHEDALLHVGPDGSVLAEISAIELFLRHGLEHLMFTAGNFILDPLHLNDIEPVTADGPYWRKGDLFLSFRHISALMLYRPSTDEIIWMQQGPWLAQHDVDILDDHRIAVFDNAAYEKGNGARVHGTNLIRVYDFATGETTTPWPDVTAKNDVKTLNEGLFSALPGERFMVEEENSGRLLITDGDGQILAQYINRAKDGANYRMGWSRYLPAAEVADILPNLTKGCAQ